MSIKERTNPYNDTRVSNPAIFESTPAAPVQEPDHGDELTIAYMSGLHDGKKKRAWVGLTDEEREGILDREFRQWWSRHDAVCRAIEAKLKEKNGI